MESPQKDARLRRMEELRERYVGGPPRFEASMPNAVPSEAGPRPMRRMDSKLVKKTYESDRLYRRSNRTIPQLLKFLRKSSKGGLATRVSEKLDALQDLIKCVEEKGVEAVVAAGGVATLIHVVASTNLANFSGLGLENVLLILSELTLDCVEAQKRLKDAEGVKILVNVAEMRKDAVSLRCVVLTLRNLPGADLDKKKAVRLYAAALVDVRPDSIRETYPDDASGRIAAAHGLMRLCPDYPEIVGQKFVIEALIGHLDLPECRAYEPRFSNLGDVVLRDPKNRRRMPEMSYTFMVLFKLAECGPLESLFLLGKIAMPTLARMLSDLASPDTRQSVLDYGQFDLPGQLLELLFLIVTRSSNYDDLTSCAELRNQLDDEFRATKLLKKIEEDFLHDKERSHLHTLAKHLRAEIRHERRCAGCGLLSGKDPAEEEEKPESTETTTSLNDDDDDATAEKKTIKKSRKLRKCSRCLTRFYCSSECQKAHYKEHRAECKALTAARDARKH